MRTTTRERERVCELLRLARREALLGAEVVACEIELADIDRVAQALREVEGATLAKVVEHLGGNLVGTVIGKKAATMTDVAEIVKLHEDRAFKNGKEAAKKRRKSVASLQAEAEALRVENARLAAGLREAEQQMLRVRAALTSP